MRWLVKLISYRVIQESKVDALEKRMKEMLACFSILVRHFKRNCLFETVLYLIQRVFNCFENARAAQY